MSREQAVAAVEAGIALAEEAAEAGADLFAVGEMASATRRPPARSRPH